MNLPKRNERHKYTFELSDGKKKIEFTPWLVKDEQEYLYATEGIEDDSVKLEHIEQLMGKCITNDINLQSISDYDFIRFAVELRKRSKGADHEIVFTCPHCKSLNESKFINLDEDMKTRNFDKTPIEISEIQFNTKQPSRKDITKLKKFESDREKRFNYILMSIDSMIINDEVYANISQDEIKRYIEEELTSEEYDDLGKEILSRMSIVAIEKTFECDHCQKKVLIYIDDITDFFG